MNLSNAARMFTTGSRPMVTTSRLGTSCPPGGGQVKVK